MPDASPSNSESFQIPAAYNLVLKYNVGIDLPCDVSVVSIRDTYISILICPSHAWLVVHLVCNALFSLANTANFMFFQCRPTIFSDVLYSNVLSVCGTFQFQSFSQYRSKLLKKGEDEVATLRANTKVCNKGMTKKKITTVII